MTLYPEKIPLLEMDLIGWYWNSAEQYQSVLVDYFTLFCTRMEQYRKGYGGGCGSRTRIELLGRRASMVPGVIMGVILP